MLVSETDYSVLSYCVLLLVRHRIFLGLRFVYTDFCWYSHLNTIHACYGEGATTVNPATIPSNPTLTTITTAVLRPFVWDNPVESVLEG